MSGIIKADRGFSSGLEVQSLLVRRDRGRGGGLAVYNIFRQHAASTYGFVRFVSSVKKNVKPLLSKVGG